MTLLQFLEKVKKEQELKSILAACDWFAKQTCQKKWTAETLRKVAYNRQSPSLLMAADIVYFSCGVIKMQELRPDLMEIFKKLGKNKEGK